MHSAGVRSKYANLGQRLAAELIDLAILFLFLWLFVMFTGAMRGVGLLPLVPEGGLRAFWAGLGWHMKFYWIVFSLLAAGPLYYALLESSAQQATIGQSLLHIHVADLQGKRIGFGRALWRWFPKWILGIVSLFTIGISPRRRCMHDYLAGTVMVRGRLMHSQLDWVRLALAALIPWVWGIVTELVTMR